MDTSSNDRKQSKSHADELSATSSRQSAPEDDLVSLGHENPISRTTSKLRSAVSVIKSSIDIQKAITTSSTNKSSKDILAAKGSAILQETQGSKKVVKKKKKKVEEKKVPAAPKPQFLGWDGGAALAPHTMTSLPDFNSRACTLLKAAENRRAREQERMEEREKTNTQGTHDGAAEESKKYVSKHGLWSVADALTSSVLEHRPEHPMKFISATWNQRARVEKVKTEMISRFPYLHTAASLERLRVSLGSKSSSSFFEMDGSQANPSSNQQADPSSNQPSEASHNSSKKKASFMESMAVPKRHNSLLRKSACLRGGNVLSGSAYSDSPSDLDLLWNDDDEIEPTPVESTELLKDSEYSDFSFKLN